MLKTNSRKKFELKKGVMEKEKRKNTKSGRERRVRQTERKLKDRIRQ
jgi:hypothetical protein